MGELSYPLDLISGTGKVTDFKFGGYIYRTYPNESPLKILEKKGAWAYPVTVQIFWVPPIISGKGKATDFKFGGYIHIGSIETKAHENVGNSGRGRSQGVPKIFRAPMYRAHCAVCAVIFAISQLSCY